MGSTSTQVKNRGRILVFVEAIGAFGRNFGCARRQDVFTDKAVAQDRETLTARESRTSLVGAVSLHGAWYRRGRIRERPRETLAGKSGSDQSRRSGCAKRWPKQETEWVQPGWENCKGGKSGSRSIESSESCPSRRQKARRQRTERNSGKKVRRKVEAKGRILKAVQVCEAFLLKNR